ncbi:sel1 repeat family protein [Vibrio kasasachensis]|uniref:sel1 repeat family protein n=1 Tax=Vibrio kasasachensis TaxID=2910248 RepID=UPI003D0E00E4
MWRKMCAVLILTSFFAPSLAASEEYDVGAMSSEKAFETGRLLRAQFKNAESRVYLKLAAENENPEALFLYAMELSNYKTTIRTPPEARKYLLKAAELGNRRAMYQLFTSAKWLRDMDIAYWRNQYYSSLIMLGRDNPSQAMYELARFHKGSDSELFSHYLDVAAGFDHPLALMDKAKSIGDDEGLFQFDRGGDHADKLYLAAAKTLYIPAIRNYISLLEDKGRYKEAYEWRLTALEQGDITSLAVVSKILLGHSSTYSFVPQDRVRAKAYIDLYLLFAGDERMTSLRTALELNEENISVAMNNKERKQSEEIYLKYKTSLIFYNHDKFWDTH